uniref:Integrin subunit alpha 10 n=1 Tax=Anser cygnoides TaxID=8845 RepID=A0A8B9D791_ANSCY
MCPPPTLDHGLCPSAPRPAPRCGPRSAAPPSSAPASAPAWTATCGPWRRSRPRRSVSRGARGSRRRAVPRGVTPCHAVLRHTGPGRVTPCCVVSHRAVPCHTVPCHTVPCCATPCHAVSHRAMSHRAMQCHVTPRCAMSHHAVTPCHVTPCHAMPCHTVLCHTVPCRVTPCRVTLCHVTPCCATPCRAMSHHVVPCHTVPCHTVPCCAMSHHVVPCHTVPCHTVPCRVTPCRAVSHRAMPCRTVPCQPNPSRVPPPAGCSTYMDIVIVLDGSNSIYPWYEVQNFLSNVLSKFFIGPGQIQVGVLQYGEHAVHEWTLGQHRTAEEVVEAARNISRQEGRETRTAFAIHQACTEAFSPERGGREDATRLMIVVTDGESHDGDELPEALEECERRNITRYAIAVLGHYLRRQQDPEDFIREIKYIASDPDEKYFFNVTDEAALNDIVDALGDRIFSLEGTHGNNESSFELEMSQIGFSIHLLEDGILFGAVGAYDWDGAVLEESRRGRIVPPREAFEPEFPLELKNHAAYLGYSVSSLRLPGGQRLFVAGAPRFQHRGKVIVFEMGAAGMVMVAQALAGEQIGSYFGSEVCALDVDGDGVTDVLLVAAPMFLGAQSRETGRVYVYRVGQ